MLSKIIKIGTFCGMALLMTACDQSSPTATPGTTTENTTVAPTDATTIAPNTTDASTVTTMTTSSAANTTQGSR